MSGDSSECLLLIIDPPADGAWNMAVDEALLDEVAASGRPVLRFYQWQQPTLSLGYFQRAADRALHAASATAAVVRRLSGGGAILHDRELTYSLILPPTHRLARDTQRLYDVVHQTLVTELSKHTLKNNTSWTFELYPVPSTNSADEEPFLCFQRRTQGDIILAPSEQSSHLPSLKIVGSAQRRRRGIVLQHGSILLSQSPLAPELLGIAETTNTQLSASELVETLPMRFAEQLQLSLQSGTLSKPLIERARHFQREKYESTDWIERR